mmetsp:Transcript_34475/g.73453  ORF Transcript_34475/g.73453 Transcript_34475/m.73453 type:complete len:280 (-) Transcript_34475:310-1149(-)|eukprot:CAMPEP_0206462678 /NCGR_PEP_ID=MMETSP0324_2-20121206/26124_1 /ASSEMBLY_ACC=CAM_ASM_000836 /TAXON_ID=2866 /ORGANISM="Crypthecodinium cohnii, Strain Seligo" /LENGTH=279 /DNA_ID=CAMNT_0053934885 /DNA_START=279 /DNA_END=1118 /DNA_ORIENTATION=+
MQFVMDDHDRLEANCVEGIIARATDHFMGECDTANSEDDDSMDEYTLANSSAGSSAGQDDLGRTPLSARSNGSDGSRSRVRPGGQLSGAAARAANSGNNNNSSNSSSNNRPRPPLPPSLSEASATPASSSKAKAVGWSDQPKKRGPPNALISAEMTRILSATRHVADLKAYVASMGGGCGKVPPFLSPVVAALDAETRYIMSLREPREEVAKPRVRLLSQGERDALLSGLKKKFQQTTGRYLQAAPKSRSRKVLEAELNKIQKDLDCLSQPYIFVEEGR